MNENTRIIDVTLGDLVDFLERKGYIMRERPSEPNLAYGIDGLAKALGCSKPTAQRMKSSGRFKGAIKQTGRKIVVDVDRLNRIMEAQS